MSPNFHNESSRLPDYLQPRASSNSGPPPLRLSDIASNIPYASALGSTYGQSTPAAAHTEGERQSNDKTDQQHVQRPDLDAQRVTEASNFIDLLSEQSYQASHCTDSNNQVLPSPAPSEDNMQETQAAQNPSTIASSERTRLQALLEKYGGVDGLESELARPAFKSATPIVPAHNVTPTIPTQNTTHSSNNASPVMSLQGSPHQQHARVPSAAPDRLPAGPGRNIHLPQGFQTPVISPSAGTNHKPIQFEASKSLLQANIAQFRRNGQLSSLIEGRAMLLIEACEDQDLFFLMLHRLYCLQDFLRQYKPESKWQLLEPSIIARLERLILSNRDLPPQALHFFARYPPELSDASYEPAMVDVRSGMAKLAQDLEHYINEWHRTRLMPHVEAIRIHLGVRSVVLQRVVFTYVIRVTWQEASDRCPCITTLNQLFRANQQRDIGWLQLHATNPGQVSSIEVFAFYQKLQNDFNLVYDDHQRHARDPANVSGGGIAPIELTRQLYSIPSRRSPSLNSQTASTADNPVSSSYRLAESSRRTSAGGERPAVAQPGRGHQLSGNLSNVPPRRSLSGPSPLASVYPPPSHPARDEALPQTTTYSTPVLPSNVQPQQMAAQQSQFGHYRPQSTMPAPPPTRPLSSNQVACYNLESRLFLEANAQRPVLPNPPTGGFALHQAHLQDAIVAPLKAGELDFLPAKPNWFSYLRGLPLEPLPMRDDYVNMEGSFQVIDEVYRRIPQTELDSLGAPPTRRVAAGSVDFRLRCIKSRGSKISESVWASSDTVWPKNITVRINDEVLDIRRKYLHGKDLPVDLTSKVVSGSNQIHISTVETNKGLEEGYTYFIAVEIIEYSYRQALRDKVTQKLSENTGEKIRSRLSSKANDIEILSDDIVINLLDPFTSQQVVTPVRGTTCTHYECFDLDVYLDTRAGNPCKPEQFKCPICGSDGRPQNLVLDSWFSAVIRELGSRSRQDVSAITVDEKAFWRIKEQELEGESGDGTGHKPSISEKEKITPYRDPIVIELD